MNINIIKWIQDWFKEECNGDWEHAFGIRIETTDNPRWCVSIDLEETKLEGVKIDYKLTEKSEADWYGFSIIDNVFTGIGDPSKLELFTWKSRP